MAWHGQLPGGRLRLGSRQCPAVDHQSRPRALGGVVHHAALVAAVFCQAPEPGVSGVAQAALCRRICLIESADAIAWNEDALAPAARAYLVLEVAYLWQKPRSTDSRVARQQPTPAQGVGSGDVRLVDVIGEVERGIGQPSRVFQHGRQGVIGEVEHGDGERFGTASAKFYS